MEQEENAMNTKRMIYLMMISFNLLNNMERRRKRVELNPKTIKDCLSLCGCLLPENFKE